MALIAPAISVHLARLDGAQDKLEMALDAFKRERQSNTDRPRDQRTPDPEK